MFNLFSTQAVIDQANDAARSASLKMEAYRIRDETVTSVLTNATPAGLEADRRALPFSAGYDGFPVSGDELAQQFKFGTIDKPARRDIERYGLPRGVVNGVVSASAFQRGYWVLGE